MSESVWITMCLFLRELHDLRTSVHEPALYERTFELSLVNLLYRMMGVYSNVHYTYELLLYYWNLLLMLRPFADH